VQPARAAAADGQRMGQAATPRARPGQASGVVTTLTLTHAQVHNGYPTDDFLLANRQLVFIAFDPTTRRILPNVTDIYPLIGSVIPAPYGGGRRLLQNGPATYQFSLAYIVPNVAVGDLIAVRRRVGRGGMVRYVVGYMVVTHAPCGACCCGSRYPVRARWGPALRAAAGLLESACPETCAPAAAGAREQDDDQRRVGHHEPQRGAAQPAPAHGRHLLLLRLAVVQPDV